LTARFCNGCGTRLTAAAPTAAPRAYTPPRQRGWRTPARRVRGTDRAPHLRPPRRPQRDDLRDVRGRCAISTTWSYRAIWPETSTKGCAPFSRSESRTGRVV